jgi:2-dehydro-3-deoxygluconokinase
VTERRFDIASFGEAMVEFNEAGHDTEFDASAPRADPARPGRWFVQGFGGDTSNLAIAAARQGARVAVLGALGEDEPGEMLRALWDAEGVNHHAVRGNFDAFTAIYLVTHDALGHHFHFVRQGSAASRVTPSRIDAATIAKARVLHLSGITLAISESSRESAWHAIALARDSGTQVSFDTNLRLRLWNVDAAGPAIDRALRHCDIALPGSDDMAALVGLSDGDSIATHCLARGAEVVAVKLGAAGALVASRSERHRIAPWPCAPVDATGAGDTFGGAFIARLLAGDSLPEAGRYAACAAALATEGYGAVAPIPRAETVRAALALASPP